MREIIRYHITRIDRQAGPIAAIKERFGWKAFVAPNTAPLCVTRDDRIEGLTYLLTLGVRVLTVMECVRR